MIDIPLNLNGGSLRVQSNAVGAGSTTDSRYQLLSIEQNVFNGVNFEVSHAYCDLSSFNTQVGAGYTGTTTLDGGYAMLVTGTALPTTTAVTLADPTDIWETVNLPQSIRSIAGSGDIETYGGLSTTANGTTFSGHLVGTSYLNVSGGTLTLTGNNATVVATSNGPAAFTGPITVTGTVGSPAAVAVNADVALGGSTSVPVTLNGGALESIASFTLNHTLTLPAGATGLVTTDAGTTLTDDVAIAGTGTLYKEGPGTLVPANGGNTFRGLSLDAGTVQISSDAGLGAAGYFVRLGGTLELLANDTVSTNRPVTAVNGTAAVDSGATLTLDGPVTEPPGTFGLPSHQSLTDAGTGTLVLANAANNYSGGTVVGGTVSVAADGDLGAAAGGITFGSTFVSSGFVHFFLGGTLVTNGSFSSARTVTVGSYGGTFAPAAGTTLALTGPVGGGTTTNGIVLNGPGTVILSGNNTFLGGAYLPAGTLWVYGDGNLGDPSGGVAFNGGTLEWFGTGTSARAVSLGNGGGTVAVASFDVLTLTGPVTDGGTVPGRLVVNGPGKLNLLHANTYSGGTQIAGATLGVGPLPAGSAGSPLGTGTVTLAGGTLALQGGVAAAAAQQQQLTASGYNQDVVVEQGATNYRSAVTTAFDSSDTASGYAFYEVGYPGSGTTGLPHVSHTFTSASNNAVAFAFQPYSANNVLLVPAGGTGTLTLSNPGIFMTIQVLAAAANGAAAVNAVLNFTDGTSATVPISVPDWFTNAAYAYTTNGRIALTDGSLQQVTSDPKLFEVDLAVPAADAGPGRRVRVVRRHDDDGRQRRRRLRRQRHRRDAEHVAGVRERRRRHGRLDDQHHRVAVRQPERAVDRHQHAVRDRHAVLPAELGQHGNGDRRDGHVQRRPDPHRLDRPGRHRRRRQGRRRHPRRLRPVRLLVAHHPSRDRRPLQRRHRHRGGDRGVDLRRDDRGLGRHPQPGRRRPGRPQRQPGRDHEPDPPGV